MHCSERQLKDWTEEFLTQLRVERNLSENTRKAYGCDLNCFRRWAADRGVEQVDAGAMSRYFAYLQEEKKLKPRSIRRHYAAVQQVFAFLDEVYGIHEKFLRFSSGKFQIPQSLPRVLSGEEVRRLLYISSDSVFRELNVWLLLRKEFLPKNEALFLNRQGERITIYNIETIFARYRNLARIYTEVSLSRKREVLMKYNGRNFIR